MLVDQLGLAIAAQQDAEIVEPGDDTLQFYAVDQEDCDWNLGFANVVQESILKILSVRSHFYYLAFVLVTRRVSARPFIFDYDDSSREIPAKKTSDI